MQYIEDATADRRTQLDLIDCFLAYLRPAQVEFYRRMYPNGPSHPSIALSQCYTSYKKNREERRAAFKREHLKRRLHRKFCLRGRRYGKPYPC